MSDTVLKSNTKSLNKYTKALDEYHRLNKISISKSGAIDEQLSRQYIITLLKIDLLSDSPTLKDLHGQILT